MWRRILVALALVALVSGAENVSTAAQSVAEDVNNNVARVEGLAEVWVLHGGLLSKVGTLYRTVRHPSVLGRKAGPFGANREEASGAGTKAEPGFGLRQGAHHHGKMGGELEDAHRHMMHGEDRMAHQHMGGEDRMARLPEAGEDAPHHRHHRHHRHKHMADGEKAANHGPWHMADAEDDADSTKPRHPEHSGKESGMLMGVHPLLGLTDEGHETEATQAAVEPRHPAHGLLFGAEKAWRPDGRSFDREEHRNVHDPHAHGSGHWHHAHRRPCLARRVRFWLANALASVGLLPRHPHFRAHHGTHAHERVDWRDQHNDVHGDMMMHDEQGPHARPWVHMHRPPPSPLYFLAIALLSGTCVYIACTLVRHAVCHLRGRREERGQFMTAPVSNPAAEAAGVVFASKHAKQGYEPLPPEA